MLSSACVELEGFSRISACGLKFWWCGGGGGGEWVGREPVEA